MRSQTLSAPGRARETQRQSPARLQGWPLTAVRACLAAVAAFTLLLSVVTVPARYAQLRTLAATGLGDGWTTEQARAALAEIGLPVSIYAAAITTLDILFIGVFAAVATMIVWRRSDQFMALFVACFLLVFGVNWTTDADWWVGTSWHLPIVLLDDLSSALFLGFFFLFPDGRVVPRRALVPASLWLVANVVLSPLLPQPVVLVLWLLSLAMCLAAQIYRYRRVSGVVQRLQAKWVVFGFGVPFVLVLCLVLAGAAVPAFNENSVAGLLYNITGRLLSYLLFLSIPAALCVAILRYRLWDIDILINRTLVYTVLTLCIVALYVLVVGYLGTLFRTSGNNLISLVGAAVVAIVFQPLRGWLQRAVNRLMYGERDEPYAALSRLGRRLDATIAPHAVFSTIVQSVAEALRLPYAAIVLFASDLASSDAGEGRSMARAETVAEVGTQPADVVELALGYQGEVLGQLRLATRAPGEQFSRADLRLLSDLALQAGVAAHAARLTVDLRRSRERLVLAREEERRRLRRYLHDELGSTLAALNLQVGAVRTTLATDPTTADALVGEVRAGIRGAIADIRRLAYELRPPALDELGLIGALRAAQFHTAMDAMSLQVTIDAPDELPALPAAVEVAAYRIVQEALTNVARHARASSCLVRVMIIDQALLVEIVDDGVGISREYVAGVGVLSMRERAAEIGGSCEIEAAMGGGTRVRVSLPVPASRVQ